LFYNVSCSCAISSWWIADSFEFLFFFKLLKIYFCLLEFVELTKLIVYEEIEFGERINKIYLSFGVFMVIINIIFDDFELYLELFILDFIIIIFSNIFAIYYSKVLFYFF
jgi:hypothetical protein